MSDLGMRITKMLFEAEPGLLNADAAASGRAAAATAEVLGCILSVVLKEKGQATYEAAFKVMMGMVNDSAHDVVGMSQAMRAMRPQ